MGAAELVELVQRLPRKESAQAEQQLSQLVQVGRVVVTAQWLLRSGKRQCLSAVVIGSGYSAYRAADSALHCR